MRRIAAVLLPGLTCLLQGCVLGVGWLPDSSGFVYTTPQGRLMAYDIAAKKSRLVLEDAAAKTTAWPGLSPTGKRIALAHLKEADDQKDALMQILICDFKGKVEFRSDDFKVAPRRGKDYEFSTQIAWSPDEKKLLVHCQGHPNSGEGFNCAVLFDIAAKKTQLWDEHAPGYFGGTPVRPDGKGFLLANAKSRAQVDEYLWVDWSGAAKRIPGPPLKDDDELLTPWTALLDSRWDGAKAIVVLGKYRYVMDTEKLKSTGARAADAIIGRESIEGRAKLASGIELLLLRSEGKGLARVVARKQGKDDLPQVIPPIRDRIVVLSLAPDAKHAVIRIVYGYRGVKGDIIHVVNNDGRVHDTITVYAKE